MILAVHDRRADADGDPAVAAHETWRRLAAGVGPADWPVDLALVDDAAMRELNARYRGRDEVTDVLSFSYLEGEGADAPDLAAGEADGRVDLWREAGPGDEAGPVGELVIAPGFVGRRCTENGWNADHEMALLVVHGLLHVLGWEHDTDEDARAMRGREADLLAAAGLPHPLGEGE